jgi:hypothetical protein
MSYLANKRMNQAGTVYEKGTTIPSDVIQDIMPLRLDALKRTRLIVEVETAPKPAGDMCPHCTEGPFQRLAQHISLKHEEVLDSLDEVSDNEDDLPVGEDSPQEEE